MTDNGPVRLLPRKEVLKLVGVSHNTLHLWVQSGHFPQPHQLNPYARFPRLAWREDEIVQWIDSRPVGRGRAAPPEVYRAMTQQAEARLAEKPQRPVLLPKGQRA